MVDAARFPRRAEIYIVQYVYYCQRTTCRRALLSARFVEDGVELKLQGALL
jgi:hypothetical protein